MKRSTICLSIIGFGFVALVAAVAFTALAGAMFIPGASDYRTSLPNGYFLNRGAPGSSEIYQDRDEDNMSDPALAVGPSQYGIVMAVRGRYIVGNLDTEEEAWGVPEIPDGYFIIDTQRDAIMKELSFEEYKLKMSELGFEELPELIRPNKRTRFPTSG